MRCLPRWDSYPELRRKGRKLTRHWGLNTGKGNTSYYTMAFVGMAPFGSPLAGSVADRIGTTMTLLVSGVLCIAGAVLFWSHLEVVRREVRPIYRELGILPQIAEGIQQATQLQWPPQE